MEWTIEFSAPKPNINDHYEPIIEFNFTVVCNHKAYSKTLDFKDCFFEVEDKQTQQEVLNFMDKKTIIERLESEETVQRNVWSEDVCLSYTIYPHYDPIYINIMSRHEYITFKTTEVEVFWAFFHKFSKIGEYYLAKARSLQN